MCINQMVTKLCELQSLQHLLLDLIICINKGDGAVYKNGVNKVASLSKKLGILYAKEFYGIEAQNLY